MENIVGQRIRQERERLGLSQEELAGLVELSSRSQVHRIETGERKVDSLLLRRFSEALEVPMDAFFDQERGEVLALARQGEADSTAIDAMAQWGLELLADIEFAETSVSSRGW